MPGKKTVPDTIGVYLIRTEPVELGEPFSFGIGAHVGQLVKVVNQSIYAEGLQQQVNY